MTVHTLGRHVVIPQMGLRVNAARGTEAAAAGWWDVSGKTCVAAYQAKGAASYAASLVNLANSGTYDLTTDAPPAWAAGTGWTFAGDSYLRLGSVGYVALDWTLLLRITARTADNSWPFSALDGSEAPAVALMSGAQIFVRLGGTASWTGITDLTNCVLGFAGITPYVDGTAGTDISETSAKTSVRATIGANDPGYGPYSLFSGTIAAGAIWSSVLTTGEMATVSTAIAAL